MKIEKVRLADLVPDDRNARTHSERNISEIMKSLQEHGQYRPFVVQKGTNKVCVGNGMLAAMIRLGMTEGDATNQSDVNKLVGGGMVDLFLTDPPYNVNYTKGSAGTIENDNMEAAAFRAFLMDAFKAADGVLKSGGAYYIWHADLNGNPFRAAVESVGWELKQILIWNKNHFTLGRQDYQWKHEPCLYGWKPGAGHYFVNERIYATILERAEDKDLSKCSKTELLNLIQAMRTMDSTVMDYDKPVRSAEHPTMKPVELIAREIKNSTKPNEIVLDTFGGSGTTLIAAEQLGRQCRIMELEPHYADVIIRRWQNFTGRQAKNAETGKAFGK